MPISESLYSSKTDMWETPQELFDELDKEFHFDLDVCAIPENAKCNAFYTPEQDGLSQPWMVHAGAILLMVVTSGNG